MPDHIFIYRDGVGDSMRKQVIDFELDQLKKIVREEYDLEYDILAQMSNSFSTESVNKIDYIYIILILYYIIFILFLLQIISTIDYTLSKHRLERLKYNSLNVQEFVTALSKTNYLYKEDFDLNRVNK